MDENSLAYRINIRLVYFSLIVLAIGAFTSISLLALSHILLAPPLIYFAFFSEKNLANSQKALLGLCVVIVLSVLFNWDEIADLKASLKFKYFLIPALGIFAYREAFKKYIDLKKRKILLHLFLLSTSLATISGLIAIYTGFNYLTQKDIPYPGRASGTNGMIMTYAYGISLLLILLTGMFLHREKIKNYISSKLLITYWIINFLGLYLSYARGAWLGFFLAVPLLFWRKDKKVFLLACTISLLTIGVSIKFNPMAKNRFLKSENSNGERISYFQAAYYSFMEKPFFGLGFGNFGAKVISIKEKYNLDYKDKAGRTHNNFLEFLSTTGLFGLSFLLLFHFFWLREGLKIDAFSDINLAFVISLMISGMVQHTLADASNLFFIMGYYAIFTSLTFPIDTHQPSSLRCRDFLVKENGLDRNSTFFKRIFSK